MTDIITMLVAEKHKLIRDRDVIMQKIARVADAIVALQEIEIPPEARPPEVKLSEVFVELPKAATSPDAPPPQPEVCVAPTPPAAPYVKRPAAPTTGKRPAPTKSPESTPISYNALIAKAAEWGITEINPNDLLTAVNAKATRLGLKPYALQSRSPH